MYGYYREKIHVDHFWELKGYFILPDSFDFILFYRFLEVSNLSVIRTHFESHSSGCLRKGAGVIILNFFKFFFVIAASF